MNREAAAAAIAEFLRALGRDAQSEPELLGTPERVANAYIDELLSGYGVDVDQLVESNLVSGTGDTVIVRGIHLATMCPHHLLPATGLATVAFRPAVRLLGLGAIVQLVDVFSKRLTLQEALGEALVSALAKHLEPRWAACRLELSHGCMVARGEEAHGTRVETFSFRGQEGDRHEAIATLKGAP
jgi:GTP cyclohydrolase I